MESEEIDKLCDEIRRLKDELAGREASIPAHSVRPHQLQAIEDLEEQIEQKEVELKKLKESMR